MNNLDHISESLETVFGVKILKFFEADPGSGMEKNLDPGWKKLGPGMEKIGIRDKQRGFATLGEEPVIGSGGGGGGVVGEGYTNGQNQSVTIVRDFIP
jgi:hypothetical protein